MAEDLDEEALVAYESEHGIDTGIDTSVTYGEFIHEPFPFGWYLDWMIPDGTHTRTRGPFHITAEMMMCGLLYDISESSYNRRRNGVIERGGKWPEQLIKRPLYKVLHRDVLKNLTHSFRVDVHPEGDAIVLKSYKSHRMLYIPVPFDDNQLLRSTRLLSVSWVPVQYLINRYEHRDALEMCKTAAYMVAMKFYYNLFVREGLMGVVMLEGYVPAIQRKVVTDYIESGTRKLLSRYRLLGIPLCTLPSTLSYDKTSMWSMHRARIVDIIIGLEPLELHSEVLIEILLSDPIVSIWLPRILLHRTIAAVKTFDRCYTRNDWLSEC